MTHGYPKLHEKLKKNKHLNIQNMHPSLPPPEDLLPKSPTKISPLFPENVCEMQDVFNLCSSPSINKQPNAHNDKNLLLWSGRTGWVIPKER